MAAWEPMLQELMTERYPRLLARARMLAVSRAEAEDLVQDALVATFQRPRRFESIGQAEQYVRRAIVTSFAAAARKGVLERQRWERVEVAEAAPDPAVSVAGALDAASAVAALPARVRACIVLRYMDDASIADTARLLSLSEGAVKRYCADGIAALNAALGTAASVDGPVGVPVTVTKGGAR
ncbi:sigma-70 family RNA polymerase sigma factor [Demequina subtropica]|uniref:sigma-70 family RNA polymerase sigma factor n=1 Tax=Demequina subtropica TaxID=1638989 RepID=UPI0007808AD3|nr:sigma-70 family RNA polymerase sigma factor [Demequina subtropica]